SNPLWNDVVGFLKANTNESRDPLDLTMKIEKVLGKTWSNAMQKTVLDSMVSILEYAELARIESGKIISLIGADESPTPTSYGHTLDRSVPFTTRQPTIGKPITTAGSDFYEYRD